MKKLSKKIKIYYQETKDIKNYYFDINEIIKEDIYMNVRKKIKRKLQVMI